MTSRYLIIACLLAAPACQKAPDAPAGNTAAAANLASANAAAPAAPTAPTSASAGCADRLVFAMNPDKGQEALQDHLAPAKLEQVRKGTEARFKTVANRMCVSGELPAAALAPFEKVVITDAEGASEPTIYAGEGKVLNYELAFAGSQDIPGEAEFHDAFLCFKDPQRGHCYED
jgi:hypothetical protein